MFFYGLTDDMNPKNTHLQYIRRIVSCKGISDLFFQSILKHHEGLRTELLDLKLYFSHICYSHPRHLKTYSILLR